MCENDTVYPLFARFPVSIHFRPDFPCNANVFVSIEEEVVVDALTEHDFLNWLDKCFVWETRDVVACKEDWMDIFTFARRGVVVVFIARALYVWRVIQKPQEQSFFLFYIGPKNERIRPRLFIIVTRTRTRTTTRVQRTRRKERENKSVILTIRRSRLPFCNT